ncbi:hypothetical protein HAX54_014377, partial [Datura stramonium]|nr:hypothetical protein [Datura stramonium]
AMASRADKKKKVAVTSKGFKRLRKGVDPISSSQKEPPFRRFGDNAMDKHGLRWFNAQKKA